MWYENSLYLCISVDGNYNVMKDLACNNCYRDIGVSVEQDEIEFIYHIYSCISQILR